MTVETFAKWQKAFLEELAAKKGKNKKAEQVYSFFVFVFKMKFVKELKSFHGLILGSFYFAFIANHCLSMS